MTICGSLYEYAAISEWLRAHDTDPLTNALLMTHLLRAATDQAERGAGGSTGSEPAALATGAPAAKGRTR